MEHRVLRRRIAAVTLAAAATVTVGATTTQALFVDQETVADNTVTTGNVDISTAPTSAVFTAASMTPGARYVRPLTVTNGGTSALRYAMTPSMDTENPDAGHLELHEWTVLSIRSGGICTLEDFATTGEEVAVRDDDSSFGDPTQGQQPGDRTLGPGVSETLCLEVSLPEDAPNSIQGMTNSYSLLFDAEQTANN